ncbi:MAG TPA: hypothetical protein PK467_07180, partial [Candidatus Wallbacteria bacterium]|nr:hypothetical protein [Candidatus Wallbacteria bacterium]
MHKKIFDFIFIKNGNSARLKLTLACLASLIVLLAAISGSQAQNSGANISARIDFGVNIFTPHFKFDE